jgi:excisionase family DNA binding protein
MFTSQAPAHAIQPVDPWLTLDEAAAVAKLKSSSVRRACRDGRLRHARVSGRRVIRIRKSWVEAWLEACAPVEVSR